MTLKYELTKRFHRKKLITICMECDKHRVNGEWIENQKREDYLNYSHGLCPDCYEDARNFNQNLRGVVQNV